MLITSKKNGTIEKVKMEESEITSPNEKIFYPSVEEFQNVSKFLEAIISAPENANVELFTVCFFLVLFLK